MSETKYVRSYYLAEVNTHFSALQCQGWLLQTIFLLCQLDGQEAPPIKGAKGDKSGGTRDLFLPISQFASSHCFFNPAVAIFSAVAECNFSSTWRTSFITSLQTPAVSWSPPLWSPGPWGQLLLKRQHHMKSHTCSTVWVSAIIPTISFVLWPRWRPSSCSCYLWYLEFFSPFLIFNLVNIFSCPDL